MKALFKKRLLKLATHLEKGKLLHEKFDFEVYNANVDEEKRKAWLAYHKLDFAVRAKLPYPEDFAVELKPYSCGTAGCALGEMPAVDKKNWNFNKYAEPHLKGSRNGAHDSANEYFGLPEGAFFHLFTPNGQDKKQFGGRILGTKAKPEQVAANIRAFIAKMESSEAK